MGQEDQADVRHRAFEGFQVDDRVMAAAGSKAVFMHCLPAHRGEEVAGSVADGPQSRIFPQAHNRLHSFRGLVRFLLSGWIERMYGDPIFFFHYPGFAWVRPWSVDGMYVHYTVLAALASGLLVRRKLDRLDLVAVLKTRE